MITRRGILTASDLRAVLGRFEPGDVVTSVATGSISFTGTVTGVDEKICKAYVDWGDGSPTQHDPDEIQHVPHFLVEKMEMQSKMASRRAGLSKKATNLRPFAQTDELFSRRDRLAQSDKNADVGSQFVGDPKTHGIDKPRGGGFSIMQNLQKDLAPEALEEAEEGPKIAPQQSGVEDSMGDGSEDQNAPGGEQNAPQIASLRSRRGLDVFQKHQLNIAIKTLKMSDMGARIMGGMTKEEAREFLKKIGWNDSKIRRLEASERVARSAQEGDEVRYVGPDGAVTLDKVYDVFGDNVETEYGKVLKKRQLQWRGRHWEMRASERSRTAAAGPHTLMKQLYDDFRRGKLEDDKVLEMWGHGMGHTRGADYVVGAGEDIVYVLINYAAGRKDKEDVLKLVKKNIRQALKDNDIFEGLRGEQSETHDIWMAYMKKGRGASDRSREATGEMSRWDIEPGGEHNAWAEDIKQVARYIQRKSRNAIKFRKMRPFDVYQGPYAEMSTGKLWSGQRMGEYTLELPGRKFLTGEPEEIAEQILEMTSKKGSMTAGTSRTIHYVFEPYAVYTRFRHTPMEWKRIYGRPTSASIKKFVEVHNKSLEPGGVNEHLGPSSAFYGGRIIDQFEGGKVVVEWEDRGIIREYKSKPMFEVVSHNRKAAKKIKYKGYTIEESGFNYYVTDPSGHRAFGETPASVQTAKKWIDLDIHEKRRKSSSEELLRSRRAMYWTDKDRVYRLTKNEQTNGSAVCPKCKKDMEKQPFTKREKLLTCPECGFKIPTSKTVTQRVEVEIEPDGSVEVEVEPVEASTRRGRNAAIEVPNNLGSMNLSEIAALISADWGRVNYAAKPYLEAMFSLDSVKDMYGMDSGHSIVAYFLSNASSWKGDVAKAVKKELKRRLR